MKKRVFLTFSSKELPQDNEVIASLIRCLDESKTFEISNRWFDKKEEDEEIYSIGVKSLLNSDLIIADVSTSSTGVGQQIALGMFHKIPVLIIAKKEFQKATHSLFLKGTKSTQVSFFYYNDKADLVKNIISVIKSKFDDKYEKLNFMATRSIKKLLSGESRKLGVSQSELLRQIIREWKY